MFSIFKSDYRVGRSGFVKLVESMAGYYIIMFDFDTTPSIVTTVFSRFCFLILDGIPCICTFSFFPYWLIFARSTSSW